jgi:hypothetical protein
MAPVASSRTATSGCRPASHAALSGDSYRERHTRPAADSECCVVGDYCRERHSRPAANTECCVGMRLLPRM